jgi:hypothetical protein
MYDIMPDIGGGNRKLLSMGRGEYSNLTNNNFSLNPGGVGGLPDPFQGHIEPGFGAFSRLPINGSEPLVYEHDLNAPVPVSRILTNTDTFKIPGENQLAFLRRGAPSFSSKHPIEAWHLAALDHYICEMQVETEKEYPDCYASITPHIIWFGYNGQNTRMKKAFAWCGFFCDGVVRLEQIVDGQSSKFSDGYVRGYEYSQRSMPCKAVSIVRSGNCEMVDEWYGRGIAICASLNLILTKKVTGSTRADYLLSGKSEVLNAQEAAVTVNVSLPTQQEMEAHRDDALAKEPLEIPIPQGPLCPYQLFPLAIADGSHPPFAFNEYVDEYGRQRHDPHTLQVGDVVFEPRDAKLTPNIRSPASGAFLPTTSAAAAFNNMRLTCLLSPSKDCAVW